MNNDAWMRGIADTEAAAGQEADGAASQAKSISLKFPPGSRDPGRRQGFGGQGSATNWLRPRPVPGEP
jgi:hypothetical protein